MSAPGDNLPLVTGMLEALTDRARAEREGWLRAEARVRALEEALGEALEAAREPAAEKALAEVREWATRTVTRTNGYRTDHEAGQGHAAFSVSDILEANGFGGGS